MSKCTKLGEIEIYLGIKMTNTFFVALHTDSQNHKYFFMIISKSRRSKKPTNNFQINRTEEVIEFRYNTSYICIKGSGSKLK